jgi:hypothetical protein
MVPRSHRARGPAAADAPGEPGTSSPAPPAPRQDTRQDRARMKPGQPAGRSSKDGPGTSRISGRGGTSAPRRPRHIGAAAPRRPRAVGSLGTEHDRLEQARDVDGAAMNRDKTRRVAGPPGPSGRPCGTSRPGHPQYARVGPGRRRRPSPAYPGRGAGSRPARPFGTPSPPGDRAASPGHRPFLRFAVRARPARAAARGPDTAAAARGRFAWTTWRAAAHRHATTGKGLDGPASYDGLDPGLTAGCPAAQSGHDSGG